MTPLDLFSLQGRTALVTGSSRSIGYALARALGLAGARVVLNGRDRAALESAAQALATEGVDATFEAFDVTDSTAVEMGVEAVEARVGPIDILVNNAGMQDRAPLESFTDEQWERITATNLDSVFYVSRAVARRMIPRGEGRIVNICSVQCELSRPGIAPYAATKAGVRMLTKGMCGDWAPKGLRVNAIAPGYFATDLTSALVENREFSDWLERRTPAGRWGQLEDLAGTVVFLTSDAAEFVNGQTIFVDGGITCVL
ncbi:MAG TPA: glucose 1-dehydrogenase [Gammaproteobacteria bacterium]|nr:glucose 1-dehydrogenase [Gammaproteobacteria bacterium]